MAGENSAQTGEPLDAAAAAPRLGGEIIRFKRLIEASRQRARHESGTGDRIILARLAADGGRRATDLAADTLLDLSTVSRQVRSLVQRGLVERRPDPDDRRGALLALTDAGRAAYAHYRRVRDAELTALLEPWPAEDRRDLIRLLARLNDDMTVSFARPPAAPGTEGHAREYREEQA